MTPVSYSSSIPPGGGDDPFKAVKSNIDVDLRFILGSLNPAGVSFIQEALTSINYFIGDFAVNRDGIQDYFTSDKARIYANGLLNVAKILTEGDVWKATEALFLATSEAFSTVYPAVSLICKANALLSQGDPPTESNLAEATRIFNEIKNLKPPPSENRITKDQTEIVNRSIEQIERYKEGRINLRELTSSAYYIFSPFLQSR